MTVRIVVGTTKGAFAIESDSSRREWNVKGPLFKGWKVTAVDRDPAGNWFVGTASFVYGATIQHSQDFVSWRQLENGPKYQEDSVGKLKEIWTLNVSGDRYYAGVADAGLFESTDRGENWQPVIGLNEHVTRGAWCPGAGGLCAHAIIVDPKNDDRIWCGISAVGVFRSDDGGKTWTAKNQGVPIVLEDQEHKDIGFCVHAIVSKPENANHIFRQDHRGMYKTIDGGDTWTCIENGLPSHFGFPIVHEHASKTLFSVPLESDEYRMPIGGRLEVYRSQNEGESWESASTGLPSENYHGIVLRGAMSCDQQEPGGVYMGTANGDLFYSLDLGDHWHQIPVRLPRIQCVSAFVI